MMEILLGCGSRLNKLLSVDGKDEWEDLVTIDFNPEHSPDILHDLNVIPFPIGTDVCSEVHAYEVIEHLGQQGDWRSFFALWSELWRILRPGGVFFGTSPSITSRWLWGDPGHTRAISKESLTFLDQTEYTKQVGNTPMSDYRFVYQADFDPIFSRDYTGTHFYALRAVKPSRISYANRKADARVA